MEFEADPEEIRQFLEEQNLQELILVEEKDPPLPRDNPAIRTETTNLATTPAVKALPLMPVTKRRNRAGRNQRRKMQKLYWALMEACGKLGLKQNL